MPEEVLDVYLATGKEVIEADHFMAFLDETIAEMGTEEPGSACDKNTLHGKIQKKL
jgi:hypothetical protein